MKYLIDTHFHLDYYKNHLEIFRQINDLQQHTICVTTSPGIYNSCVQMYSKTKYVTFALGFHPKMQALGKREFSDFQYLFNSCKYIGEVGLDFTNQNVDTNKMQLEFFGKIVNMCSVHNKIMSVHLRNDNHEGKKIIQKYKPKNCIIHWFSGSYCELMDLIELDCYFSINENMIRNVKKNKWLLEIPKEKILIESDGPFTKVNGKKYSPCLLAQQYENIARFLEEPELVSLIYENFKRILNQAQ